jgi:hypothetical protein
LENSKCEFPSANRQENKERLTIDHLSSAAGTPSKTDKIAALKPAHRNAYFALQFACQENKRAEMEDPEAWDWLKENGLDGLDELSDYELPSRKTFADYCNRARTALGENKYSRRAGRTGGSVRKRSEV